MSRPISPRLEITVLKDKSTTDKAQVPATDATIHLYRQGATVKTQVTLLAFEEDVPVSVYDTGYLAAGDLVRFGDSQDTLNVMGVAEGVVTLTSNFDHPVALAVGTRLQPTGNRPSAYADPLATQSLGSSIGVDATTARASAYLSKDRVDFEVAIPGHPPRWYLDAGGMLGRSDQRWNDLRDFGGNLQAAIDALPADGGIVFIPRGEWLLTSGVLIEKPGVTLLGEQAGSVLKAQTPNGYDLITVKRQNFQARDLTIDGGATTHVPDGKSCLVLLGVGASGHLVLNVNLQNVRITRAPRYGLYLRDVILFLAENCRFDGNAGTGARIESVPNGGGATTTNFTACSFSTNGDRGCTVNQSTLLTFLGCTFEGNKGGVAAGEGNGLDATSCVKIEVVSSRFRSPDTNGRPEQFAYLNFCNSAVVDGCQFDGSGNVNLAPTQGVTFANSRWARLSSNVGTSLWNYLAKFDSESKDCVELGNSEVGQEMPRLQFDSSAPRVVGMSRRSLSCPVVLDSELPPAAANPLRGSLLWDRDTNSLRVWNGTQWKTVTLS